MDNLSKKSLSSKPKEHYSQDYIHIHSSIQYSPLFGKDSMSKKILFCYFMDSKRQWMAPSLIKKVAIKSKTSKIFSDKFNTSVISIFFLTIKRTKVWLLWLNYVPCYAEYLEDYLSRKGIFHLWDFRNVVKK